MATNEQLYIALGVPLLFQTVLIGFVVSNMNAKFKAVDVQLKALNGRMDHMQEMWRDPNSGELKKCWTRG